MQNAERVSREHQVNKGRITNRIDKDVLIYVKHETRGGENDHKQVQ